MLRFKHFLDHDAEVDAFVEKLWEVSLIGKRSDYEGTSKHVKLNPKTSDLKKKVLDLVGDIDADHPFWAIPTPTDNTDVPKIHKDNVDVKKSKYGIRMQTEVGEGIFTFDVLANSKTDIESLFYELKDTKPTTNTYVFDDGSSEEIISKKLSSAEATSLYEATASVALGIGDTNKLQSYLNRDDYYKGSNLNGTLIKEFFADLDRLEMSVGGFKYKKWDYEKQANDYLLGMMGIIKGAILFRNDEKFVKFFTMKPKEVLWNNIDRDYKNNWFREISGATDPDKATKENTADVVVFNGNSEWDWASLQAADKTKLYMKESDSTDGAVKIFFEDKEVAEILQLSLKLSKKGAQGGKSLVALAGLKVYDKTRRYDLEDLLWKDDEITELFNIGNYIKKGASFIKSVLTKLISKIKSAIWSVINRLTSKSGMNRSLSKITSKLNKGVLREGLRDDQTAKDKFYSSGNEKAKKAWGKWKQNSTSKLREYARALDNSLDGKLFRHTGDSAVDATNKVISNMSDKEYIREMMLNLPVNMTAMEVMTNISKKIQKDGEKFQNAVRVFNSLSFDISMGDSEVPVIKLYGVAWSPGDKESGKAQYDVVKRIDVKDSSSDIYQKIEKLAKEQPMGGFFMQPSTRSNQGLYLATYMFIFYEHKDDDLIYKKMQIRPDMGGIAAESYPQDYIWNETTETFDQK